MLVLGSVLVILATYDSSETDDEGRDTLVGQNVVGSVTFRYRDRGGVSGGFSTNADADGGILWVRCLGF